MLRARLADAALTLAFLVAAQVEMRIQTSDGYDAGGRALNTVLLLLFTAGLLAWRVAPGAALAWMCLLLTGASVLVAHDAFFWTTVLPLALVVFQTARQVPGPVGRFGWVAATVALYSDAIHDAGVRDPGNLVTALLIFGGAGAGGRLLRHLAVQRDRLDAALSELAAEQARREEAAALTERNRIATEMHDVVAHAVGEMVIQVGAARLGLQAAHLAVPDQLTAAETTGRQALVDLRRSLGLMPDHPEHDLAPVPGLGGLDRLVSGFREAGLDVHLAPVAVELHGLSQGLQLAIHRVLQESLTNALKHAGRVRVDVHLGEQSDGLVLEVVNGPRRGQSAALPSGRHGLAGMRERVAVHDGALEAGPTPDGGWRVRARWPAPVGAVA